MSFCFIVGAGPGLGLSLVRRFSREGCKVAAVSRDLDRCSQLVSTVGNSGTVKAFAGDAENIDDLKRALDDAIRWNGGVGPDIVIYNAATMSPGLASQLPSSFMDDLRVTLTGAVTLATSVADRMKAAGSGTILFTGGGLSLEPHPMWSVLGMGKAALRNYAGALHRELLEANINVAVVTIAGIIEPGTAFDPDTIAATYWAIHSAPKETWTDEVIYMPGGNRLYNVEEKGVEP